MNPRRMLAATVLLCAAGAAVVLFAADRTWAVELTPRPEPLPDLRAERTGGTLLPWLPALGWVALAGAGVLLATRGGVRQVAGGLLALTGVAQALLAGAAAADPAVPAGWPALAAAGGAAVAAAGGLTAGGSRRWPAMSARYERHPSGGGPAAAARVTAGGDTADGGQPPTVRAGPEVLWDALDRGRDPTDG